MKAKHIQTGKLGEDIATKYLIGKGFDVIERNYRNGYGELDIVCRFIGNTHFVEVKTVTRETETNNNDVYRPEDNLHEHKIRILRRTVDKYLVERKITQDWSIDLLAVELHVKHKKAKVRLIENIG